MDIIFKKLALVGDIWVLWMLVGASVLSLAIMFERWLAFKKQKINFPLFLNELRKQLENNDLIHARKIAKNFHCVESEVVCVGLSHFKKGPFSMEQAMLSHLTYERNRMEHNLMILNTLGNNAPFIGLFGTVLGIIKAFDDLALSGSAGVSVVMTGISSALIATAFGIFVAIPAVMANNYFQTRIRRMHSHAQTLIHLLQAYSKNEGSLILTKQLQAESAIN